MKFDTIARKKLKKLKIGPSNIARALGTGKGKRKVSPSTASRWLSGDSRPDDTHRPIIESLWGIPSEDWRTAQEARDLAAHLATACAATGTEG